MSMKRLYVAHHSFRDGDGLVAVPHNHPLAMSGLMIDEDSTEVEKQLAAQLVADDSYELGDGDFVEIYALEVPDTYLTEMAAEPAAAHDLYRVLPMLEARCSSIIKLLLLQAGLSEDEEGNMLVIDQDLLGLASDLQRRIDRGETEIEDDNGMMHPNTELIAEITTIIHTATQAGAGWILLY